MSRVVKVWSWSSLLWEAMRKTGRGYHRPSSRHTGKGQDRRPDKLVVDPTPIFRGRLNIPRSQRA